MYVDMSMLEWVDQTQMAPEAGVVDAAQKDNVETSYRSKEFRFAAILQYFEESRLASMAARLTGCQQAGSQVEP